MYKSGMTKINKGFTLIELLIVIAILAVLSTASVVVLNPAELLKQARDSQRIQNLANLVAATGIYVAQSTDSPLNLGACAAGGRCTFDPTATHGPFIATTCATISVATTVAGAGWVDVNFTTIPSGVPLAVLPLDPTQTATYFLGYMCEETGFTFQYNCRLESTKFRDLMKTDGGNRSTCTTYISDDCWYEVGNHPGLDL
jgi:prepilin-type N-terminal cleavage/methylation domain-containing protein